MLSLETMVTKKIQPSEVWFNTHLLLDITKIVSFSSRGNGSPYLWQRILQVFSNWSHGKLGICHVSFLGKRIWSDSGWLMSHSYIRTGRNFYCKFWMTHLCRYLILLFKVANLHTRTVRNLPDGTFSLQELQDKIRPPVDVNRTVPRTSLICLENTHNKCSGAVLPLSFIDDVSHCV